jgi:predicted ferric reductase
MARTSSSHRGRTPNYVLLGSLWLGLYALAVALPLLALLIGPLPAGREFSRELSVSFGFAGASILCVQFALTARFKHVQAPFGIDLVYHFHRHFFVCGPDEMMDMAEDELHGHGIGFGRVHSERFDLV